MKVFYEKQKPTIITYPSNKHFSNEVFMADVHNSISQVIYENNEYELDISKTALNEVIQRQDPIKQQYVRANQAPFINKKINKEIMKSRNLEMKF